MYASHPMGFAASGYTKHWLSNNLCLVGQHQSGRVHWYQSWLIQTMSSRPLFPSGSRRGRFVTDLIQDAAHCTYPYHLTCPLKASVISLMPSSWSSETEVVSSWSLVPQIHWIMARLLWWSRSKSEVFGTHVSLPQSIAEQTQAVYTSSRTLGKRCLEVRTGSDCLNYPQETQHLAAMVLSHPLHEPSMSTR